MAQRSAREFHPPDVKFSAQMQPSLITEVVKIRFSGLKDDSDFWVILYGVLESSLR